ncbi:MAG: hypothetical protein PHV93_04430 [Candidatus Pacebacteria bacterium]|nr:hypothetical protein [Candidatus Paceibacterota bacterium]
MDNPERRMEAKEVPVGMNLLTNFDATLDAMGQIEGEAWYNFQKARLNGDFSGEFDVASALNALREEQRKSLGINQNRPLESAEEIKWQGMSPDRPHWKRTIYGDGGWHRYFLRSDGSVHFSRSHMKAVGDEETMRKVTSLGFNLWGK